MDNVCACGCGQTFETSSRRGEPRRFYSNACKQRHHRKMQKEQSNRNVTVCVPVRVGKPAPPLKYPGSKWLLAQWIVSQFPEHSIYVEPFFGSGACFFNKQACDYEVINDRSDQVVNLFRMLRERGNELAALIDLTPWSRTEYYQSYEQTGDALEDARRFLVRCWQAHGAKTSDRTGWMNRGVSASGSTVQRWKKVPDRILASADRLKDAEIENIPALDLIDRFKDAEHALIYCDPPYILKTRHGRMYEHEMTDQEHCELLDALDRCKCAVVLSGYAHPLYDDRLKHWQRLTTPALAEKGQSRIEVLWLNRSAKRQQLSLFEA